MPSEMPSNQNQLSLRRSALSQNAPYEAVFGDVSKIIDAARESAARSVNAAMTAAYWLIGRRHRRVRAVGRRAGRVRSGTHRETGRGPHRARFGRGFSRQNVQNMRLFYLAHTHRNGSARHRLAKLARLSGPQIFQTASGEFTPPSVEVGFDDLLSAFPAALVRLREVCSP